ncbi:trypsin-like serine peptidase [Roseomonas sp. KE2513]|uniref:trypsin-like serine peptidase n=1 Tax=Roseomonas sp. KE2513 TaxID=2479202 RepID=UPI0035CC32B7
MCFDPNNGRVVHYGRHILASWRIIVKRLLKLLLLLPLSAAAQQADLTRTAGPCSNVWGTDKDGEIRLFGVHGSIDTRVDAFRCTDPAVQRNARATVALLRRGRDFDESNVALSDTESVAGTLNNLVTFHTVSHGSRQRQVFPAQGASAIPRTACRSERFREQNSYASCSGVLISPTTVLTAAHCIEGVNPRDLLVVMDLAYEAGRAPPLNMPTSDDRLRRITWVAATKSAANQDMALLHLAGEPVRNRALGWPTTNETIRDGQSVYALGHPDGLPLKLAPGGRVSRTSNVIEFATDLPIFHGNSGGPIFDTASHRLLGIVRSGPSDWYYRTQGPDAEDRDCATSLCAYAPEAFKASCNAPELANRLTMTPPWLRMLSLDDSGSLQNQDKEVGRSIP